MHILFLTDNFPPEVNAPASRTFEHCREWVRLGHRVTVITCAPNFPNGHVFDGYRNRLWSREVMEGIDVVRVWTIITPNSGFLWRTLDYASFMLAAIPASLFVRDVDILVATSPQLFTPCAALIAGGIKRRRFVFELRDLWPESIRAVGAMGNSRVLNWLEALELFLYRRSAHVVSVTNAFRENLIERGIPADKISVTMNGADLSRFQPRPRDEALVEELGFPGKIVVGYVGTLGMAHGLSTVLGSAALLHNDPRAADVHFLFLGDGAEKAALKAEAARKRLDNVTFIDSVPRSEVVRYWTIVDMAVIHLKRVPLFETVVPSKLFECMAMGIPVLHGVAGESSRIVEREGVGLTFEAENAGALAAHVIQLAGDPARRLELSKRGVEAARRFDRTVLARQMLGTLQGVCKDASRAGVPKPSTEELRTIRGADRDENLMATAYTTRTNVRSWGRTTRTPQRVAVPRSTADLPGMIAARPNGTVLPMGLRRSYGDSVLNSGGGLIDMTGLNRILSFDTARGVLRAEAGATLSDIMRTAVPHGFFLAVTPGTRFVTLGGAIANDVHGKNHHSAGTFGRHVLRLGLVRSDGLCEIGPDSDLFAATVGGIGLTGLIEWAEIRLQPIGSADIDNEIIPFGAIDEFWQLAEGSSNSHEHTVAWIDCLAKGRQMGRGIFSRGNWSSQGALKAHDTRQPLGMPVEAPSCLLNRATVGLLNRAYNAVLKRKAGPVRQHYSGFFHPLDRMANWNRLYGRNGFWQYQCVVPPPTMKDAIPALLGEISSSGQGSFLTVLKTFGNVASPGLMSFPMEGATLALDFPNRGERTLRLLSRLDSIVKEAGGRLYAAKDGRLPKDMWAAGYPLGEKFASFVDPAFQSDFWRRVAPSHGLASRSLFRD